MTLLDELKAARDLNMARHVDGNSVTDLDHVVVATTWGAAISIVERYLEPMKGLDAHALAGLVDRYPCLPGERHTFDAGAKVCLCGALAVGIALEHPQVCLFAPAAEVAS
jgi:hypothetical protein